MKTLLREFLLFGHGGGMTVAADWVRPHQDDIVLFHGVVHLLGDGERSGRRLRFTSVSVDRRGMIECTIFWDFVAVVGVGRSTLCK